MSIRAALKIDGIHSCIFGGNEIILKNGPLHIK